MMRDRNEILRLASQVLEQYLSQTRRHEDDIHDQDAVAALLEVVVTFARDSNGPTPVLRLVNRVLAEQRNAIPEIQEAMAEREARAAIAVPNGGPPDMSELLASLKKAVKDAYPERPKRRRRASKAIKPQRPRPSWFRGVIEGGPPEEPE